MSQTMNVEGDPHSVISVYVMLSFLTKSTEKDNFLNDNNRSGNYRIYFLVETAQSV